LINRETKTAPDSGAVLVWEKQASFQTSAVRIFLKLGRGFDFGGL
jgi:hypothetical protein